jgi:hypothetical protein
MESESALNNAPDGTGHLSADNGGMTYILLNAVKELKQEMEAMNNSFRKKV